MHRNLVVRVAKPVKRLALLEALRAAFEVGRPSFTQVQPAVANGHTPEASPPKGALPAVSARPYQILLVEDNAVNQMVGVTMLKKLGYGVDVAVNGEEAIDALQKQPYDLVLMDIHMPGMDGHQATMTIRDPQSPVLDHQIPVIAMTASVLPADREACIRSGMNDFISKPIRSPELAARLKQWLNDPS
jgi:CheY-like chemotaxis protein